MKTTVARICSRVSRTGADEARQPLDADSKPHGYVGSSDAGSRSLTMRSGGSWPAPPRRLRPALRSASELAVNAISLMIVALLILYIILLLGFDSKIVDDVPAPASFLLEMSQLVCRRLLVRAAPSGG